MSIKEQVRALWTMCFDDTEEFVDLYFRMRYTDHINCVVEKDGKVISALQMIPYSMTYGGILLPVSYISGACTHPVYRNQGAMRLLLKQAHRRMYEEGIMFSTLIPAEEWLKSYYARAGYATCFHVEVEKKVINSSVQLVDNSCSAWNIHSIHRQSSDFKTVYRFFDEQMRLRPCCIQHTSDDFELILADLELSGGACWAIHYIDRLVGVVFCLPHAQQLEIKEMLLLPDVSSAIVLSLLGSYYHIYAVELTLPPVSGLLMDLGMARVIHAEACLRHYAGQHPEEKFCLCVQGDEAIPENNGYYRIEGGECHRLADTDPLSSCLTCHISSLTRLLLEKERPYMSLMLN